MLHLIILSGVHQYIRNLLSHWLQNVTVFFNFIKILNHQEFIQNESERINYLMLVSLDLISRLVWSLNFDLSNNQFDNDFENSLIIHDEASLWKLGLMPLYGFFLDFIKKVKIYRVIGTLIQLFEATIIEVLTEILSKCIIKLVERLFRDLTRTV